MSQDEVDGVSKGLAWYRRNRERLIVARRKRRAADPDKREHDRLYYRANHEKIRAKVAAWNAALTPDQVIVKLQKQKFARWKKQYNLSPVEFDNLHRAQKNGCGICHVPFRDDQKACIDHCHRTGIVRGLLCRKCNAGIGHFQDDLQLLGNAIQYLKGSK